MIYTPHPPCLSHNDNIIYGNVNKKIDYCHLRIKTALFWRNLSFKTALHDTIVLYIILYGGFYGRANPQETY